MSITTHSLFFFNYEVEPETFAIDFDEGGDELQASLDIGSYSLNQYIVEIARALNAVGSNIYTVTVNRNTRVITISADGAFNLLVSSGSRVGFGAWPTMGFTGADRTGDDSYTGDETTGQEYRTQFILQSYLPSSATAGAADGVVNTAASGRVEVVTFGRKQFMKANFQYVTSRDVSGSNVIRNDAQGYEKLVEFMNFLITKKPIEFMPDENDVDEFETFILESTPTDKNGISFELKEHLGQKLPEFWETAVLTFRKID